MFYYSVPTAFTLTLCLSVVWKSEISHSTFTLFDLNYPLILKNNVSLEENYFGFSVALASSKNSRSEISQQSTGWIFIGAPKGDSLKSTKTGALWRCKIGTVNLKTETNSDTCEIIELDPQGDGKKRPFGPRFESNIESWRGGSLEIHGDRLVTCASRWIRGKEYMNGLCFWLPNEPHNQRSFLGNLSNLGKGNTYDHRLVPLFTGSGNPNKDQMFGRQHEWANGQTGISAHIVRSLSQREVLLGVPGAREWSGAVTRYRDSSNPRPSLIRPNLKTNQDFHYSEFQVAHRRTQDSNEKNNVWNDYFGYSVNSGRYFDTSEILYSAGAPRGNKLTGEVVIFSIPPSHSVKTMIKVETVVKPPDDYFGSYFGFSLHSVDIDNDGRDELFIGAPQFSLKMQKSSTKLSDADDNKGRNETKKQQRLWNSGDQGCVSFYKFGKFKDEKLNPEVLYGGEIAGARFGTSISSFKIDEIGKPTVYVVIGSPYELFNENPLSSGAIYIYKSPVFKKYFRRILASEIQHGLQGFGYSLSNAEDLDNNQTPDMAIGSHVSENVVILRSRPQIKIESWINFPGIGTTLRRTFFTIHVSLCQKITVVFGKTHEALDLMVEFLVDERLTIEKPTEQLSIVESAKSKLVYKLFTETVTNKNTCTQFSVKIDDPNELYKNDDVKPLIFKSSSTYNATHLEQVPLVYTITDRKFNNFPSKFQDFNPRKPSYATNVTQTKLEISPTDCANPVCRPNITIASYWQVRRQSQGVLQIANITEHVIGTNEDIHLILFIQNSGETAIKPHIYLSWSKLYGIELKREKWYVDGGCASITSSHNEVNCQFKYNVQKYSLPTKTTISFTFSTKNLIARSSAEDFKITILTYSKDMQSSDKKVFNVTLPLKSEAEVQIFGSKNDNEILRNPLPYNYTQLKVGGSQFKDKSYTKTVQKTLYAPWKQTFSIVLRGPSVPSMVLLQFKLPMAFKHDNMEQILILVKPPEFLQQNYIECVSENAHWHSVDTTKVLNIENHSSIDDKLFPVLPSSNENFIFSSSESPLEDYDYPRRAKTVRREVNDPLKHVSTLLKMADRTAFINCANNSTINGYSIVCMNLSCKLQNKFRQKFHKIGFEMYFVQESIDFLLQEGIENIVVESFGSATIFDGVATNHKDNDVAQTQFHYVVKTISWWTYFSAAFVGILLLLIISLAFYKCGFFQRTAHDQLQNLKAEIRKSKLIPIDNAKLNDENPNCTERPRKIKKKH